MPTPGHALLPTPNGMNLNPYLSPLVALTLSGLNLVGSSHSLRSLCMDHAFTNKFVPCGIWNPLIVQFYGETWGNKNGTTGYSLSASLMTQRRYGSLARSRLFIKRSCPTWLSISALIFCNISGWSKRSDIVHSMVVVVVSIPATNIIWST